MTNSNTANQLGTLETEGHALARVWRARDKVERSQFVSDTKSVLQCRCTISPSKATRFSAKLA